MMNSNSLTVKIGVYLCLILIALGILLPMTYVFLSSFKVSRDMKTPQKWLPIPFTLEHYDYALNTRGLGKGLLNSFIVGSLTTVIALFVLIPGSYVFARKEFPGKEVLFYLVAATLFYPAIMLIVPLTINFTNLGLYDNLLGVSVGLQTFVLPFSFWLMRGYFSNLPENLEEAAMVYGCTDFGAFFRVLLPLARPAILAIGFLLFVGGWNDFLYSNMLTASQNIKPSTVILNMIVRGAELVPWGGLMASTMLVMIVPVTLYTVSQWFLGGFSGLGTGTKG